MQNVIQFTLMKWTLQFAVTGRDRRHKSIFDLQPNLGVRCWQKHSYISYWVNKVLSCHWNTGCYTRFPPCWIFSRFTRHECSSAFCVITMQWAIQFLSTPFCIETLLCQNFTLWIVFYCSFGTYTWFAWLGEIHTHSLIEITKCGDSQADTFRTKGFYNYLKESWILIYQICLFIISSRMQSAIQFPLKNKHFPVALVKVNWKNHVFSIF